MAAGDLWPTLRFREMLMDGTVTLDWDSATIHLLLAKASLTAYVDNTHLADLGYLGSVTAEIVEVDGADTGKLIPSLSVTLSSSFVLLKGGAVTFSSTSSGGGTARFGLLVRMTGTENTSPIIAILDLGADRALTGASNSTPLTVSWTDNKVIKFSGTGTPALG
jgi:hypothetical protein